MGVNTYRIFVTVLTANAPVIDPGFSATVAPFAVTDEGESPATVPGERNSWKESDILNAMSDSRLAEAIPSGSLTEKAASVGASGLGNSGMSRFSRAFRET